MSSLPPGTRLGRYELGRLLGVGGAGEVYAAVLHGAAGFRKPVALKVLHPDTDDGEELAYEARLGGLLQHPNLVDVYALEQVDDVWVCAMELVLGGSLRDLLPLPPRAVLDVGLQVCRGLQHAHDQIGLVHLDLKPANLLIDHGVVKVADLGIAMARGFRTDGRVRGTPAYMSPEQFAGRGLDARADIYSLGVTLIELATGIPDVDPSAVPWLEPVTRRCLAPDRRKRFASMLELADALVALPPQGAGLAEFLGQRSPVPQWAPTRQATSSDTWTLDPSVDDRPRTNIARAADRFVGRGDAVETLVALLDGPGVITVKGAGGLGKTRLARRAARMWLQGGHQAWFCDLQTARTRMDVLLAVGSGLGVPASLGSEAQLADGLGYAMAGRGEVVVLLDNFEQVLPCRDLVARWAELAPKARLLVTSRAALSIAGEQVVELAPMTREEAVELLIERATDRGLDVSSDPDLGALAERLDGIPLALELAAGRLGLMSAGAMLSRLNQRFRLLRSGHRDATARQATLRATLDWSWDLLDPTEQAAFAQCGVFAGGFAVDAAEAILDLPGDTWALDVIDALLDRSLLTERDGQLRLFESAREYALERLENRDGAMRRHGEWFAQYGDERAVRATLLGSSQPADTARRWIDDIAAAARRAIASGWAEIAVPTSVAAWWVYEVTGPYGAGLELLEQAAELDGNALLSYERGRAWDACGDPAASEQQYREAEARSTSELLTARVRGARGRLRIRRGAVDDAQSDLEAALAVLRDIDGASGARATVLNGLAWIASRVGDPARAHEQLEQAVAEAREGSHARQLAVSLSNLGKVHADLGNLAEAHEAYSAAMQEHRRRGEVRHEAILLGNLGLLEADRGRVEEAVEMLKGAVALHRTIGERRIEGTALCNLGNLSADLGRRELAEQSFVEAIAIFDEYDDIPWGGIARGFLARLHKGGDQLDQAAELIAQAVERTRQMPLAWASFLGLQGEIKGLRGEPGGLDDLEQADATMQRGQWRRDRVGVLCAWARFHARSGDLERASELVAEAEEISAALGMHPGSPMGLEIASARGQLDLAE